MTCKPPPGLEEHSADSDSSFLTFLVPVCPTLLPLPSWQTHSCLLRDRLSAEMPALPVALAAKFLLILQDST